MGFVHCNLRVLMAERGLNIQNVKDKTTLSRTTISNLYNNNGSGVQYDTLVQLCTLLKCTPGDILTFVDISLNFEDITTNTDVNTMISSHVLDSRNDSGYDFLSQITTSLIIECKLFYEGNDLHFKFKVDITADLDEEKHIDFDKITSKEFTSSLDSLNAPLYVKDYINEKLDLFLFEWISDYVNAYEFEK